MKNAVVAALLSASVASFGLAACSEETQDNAELAAERAGEDIEANAEVAGEVIEEGAIDASEAVAEGAGNLAENLREGDTEEPGPAPVTGDDLSE